MTPEQERWAEAVSLHRLHGDCAPVFVAERIGALAMSGDDAGVRRWKEIARRLNTLMAPPMDTAWQVERRVAQRGDLAPVDAKTMFSPLWRCKKRVGS